MCSSTAQTGEELSDDRPLHMRSSGGHGSSPHRPGRSTTDENGSPVILRRHETSSSKSLSSLQAQVHDPVTPPQPSLQSSHVFRPVVFTPTATRSSHLFTPVASAAGVPSSKSTHNSKPVTNDLSSIESGHNFKPMLFDEAGSPKSPHGFEAISTNGSPKPKSGHNFKPMLFDESGSPRSPHDNKSIIKISPSPKSVDSSKSKVVDEPKSPGSPSSVKSILVSPGTAHKSLRKTKSVSFEESDATAGAPPTFAGSDVFVGPPSAYNDSNVTAGSSSASADNPPSAFVDSHVAAGPSSAFNDWDVTAGPSPAFADDPFTDSHVIDGVSSVSAGSHATGWSSSAFINDPSGIFAATGPPFIRVDSRPDQDPSTPVESPFLPPEARFLVDPRTVPFKIRYKPYVPRARAPEKVTFPNGLDGNNPYRRPYGGGLGNDKYHLFEQLPQSKLLADPYANAYQKSKKQSSHNYYGGRSAAQRESTRHVYRANNSNLVEEYEMDNLSAPQLGQADAPSDTKPKSFVGTAISTLAAVRNNVKVTNAKAKEATAKPKAEYKPHSVNDLIAALGVAIAEEEAQEKREAKELKKAQRGPGLVSRWKQRREDNLLARARRNYEKDVEEERKQKEKAAVLSPPVVQPDDVVEHHGPEAPREAQELQRALDMEEARRGKKKVTDLVG